MAGTAVVTGGSAGIGLATAERLAKAGWNVAIVARDAQRLEDARAMLSQYGGQILAISADVANAVDVDAAADRIERDSILVLLNFLHLHNDFLKPIGELFFVCFM